MARSSSRTSSPAGCAPPPASSANPPACGSSRAHKSINLVEITFYGKAAHSSLTPQGVNAIEYASRAVVFIRQLADEFKESGPYDDAYVVPFTTASVNIVNGGIAANIVPDRCTVQLEFRSISGVDAHEVLGRISAHCDELQEQMRQEHPEAGVEVRTLAMVPGLDTGRSSPALALGALLGGTPSTDKVTYGTEAGLFQAAGIETVVCGPGDIAAGALAQRVHRAEPDPAPARTSSTAWSNTSTPAPTDGAPA